MSTIYELRADRDAAIFAVPYRAMKRRRPARIPDGAIVESVPPDQLAEAPPVLPGLFEVARSGEPATIHHVNLGLVAGYLRLAGVFFLPGGEVAAVYGAKAVPIGAPLPASL
ncbi:hypothetical protein [Paludisphaera mucosa]|uniref:Uncharacterized protein n=1 Tax=Paludisphaera mucosa TaxID=3030827 RepID=A0ABT6FJJ0_9BACT|nr:hypothetical protein [Paludisphaera mucosa]MDG3007746.1 hypothetical protein [Paludisphaera mucosa]